MTENYLCILHKNNRKHSQHFKLLFLTKFKHWYIKLNIYMYEIKFTSHKHSLFGYLFSRNEKKTHIDQSFILCQIKTTQKPTKVIAEKKFFSSGYVVDITCFEECFLFQVINERHYLL